MLFRYRLFLEDGSDAGVAHHAVRIKPDEIVWTNGARKLRVLDVVPVEDNDSPYEGLLKVEAT